MITTEAPGDTTSAGGKNRWFQLGLVSAGAAAPLIARWRSLRAEEQAQALREQAVARWNETLARIVASGRPEALQEALRQMAPQAQESFRQVGAAARDALQRLPGATQTPGVADAADTAVIPPTPATRRVSATLWLVGVGVGVVAAGAVAYIVLRNRMSAATDDDALVEIPLTVVSPPTDLATAAASAAIAREVAAEGPAIVQESPEEEPGIAEPIDFSETDADGATFVGNIHSRIYHAANSTRLPAPQHRIYFATEQEAIEMGYRRDSTELTSPSGDAAGQRD
ncbi:MAG TPA: hypothetical protein VFN78_03665 [Ktedonobacterales bacterium]|nr:hypothetical protein [Ktedonobacterales bacterium]